MELLLAQVLASLAHASILFLAASGLSLVFGVTRIVNLAHGSFYMLGAYIGFELCTVLLDTTGGFWLAALLAAIITGAVGVVLEVLVLRRLYHAPELVQLVATFGLLLIIQEAALWLWGPEDLLGPRIPGLEGAVVIAGAPIPAYDLAIIALTPPLLLGLWLLLKSRSGILIRAAAQDRTMLQALGVNQAWLFTGVFFLGTALAGFAGAIQLPRGGANLFMDINILATVFVIVVIGGMGSMPGAYGAALLIATFDVFGVYHWPQGTLAMTFIVMAAVLLYKPHGLLGLHQQPPPHPHPPIRPASPRARLATCAALIALGCVPLLSSTFLMVLLIDVMTLVLFAASLHFIVALGGIIAFGHAAFLGVGAYGAALLVQHTAAPMPLTLTLAPLAAAGAAFVIGGLALRLRGVYFSMFTLACAQLLWSLTIQWTDVLGGDDGILHVWPDPWADSTSAFYVLTLTLTAAGVLALRHLAHTPFGYALRAVRDHPERAATLGLSHRAVQWAAFTIAGGMAGLAGVLFTFSKGSVFPSVLELERSFEGLIMVFLGGVASLSGGLSGAASFALLKDVLVRFEFWRLTLGGLIVAIVMLAPDGISGGLQRLTHALCRRLHA